MQGGSRDERAAFEAAAGWFLDEVRHAAPRLDDPALGVWSVRDLIGHTSRALTTIRAYLTTDGGPVELAGPLDYYRHALGADPGTVAARGRDAGLALGADVAAAVAAIAVDVRRAVSGAPDDAVVATPFGRLTLVDYLPTRTFELVVHTCDLAAAAGRVPRPPDVAAVSALRLAADLTLEAGDAGAVLLALTGRRPLPPGFTVLRAPSAPAR